MGYNAVQFVESQLTFRRNMSPPLSGSKNKPRKKLASRVNVNSNIPEECRLLGRCVGLVLTDVSEEHVASTFRVEEQARR
jgi:hypothetical protein